MRSKIVVNTIFFDSFKSSTLSLKELIDTQNNDKNICLVKKYLLNPNSLDKNEKLSISSFLSAINEFCEDDNGVLLSAEYNIKYTYEKFLTRIESQKSGIPERQIQCLIIALIKHLRDTIGKFEIHVYDEIGVVSGLREINMKESEARDIGEKIV